MSTGTQLREKLSTESELRALEEQLLQPDFRRNRKAVSEILTDDFREFGSAGRIWNKQQILDLLEGETFFRAAVRDFATKQLSADTILVTYIASVTTAGIENFASLRSSLWVRRDGRWQMLFHQGTPTNKAN